MTLELYRHASEDLPSKASDTESVMAAAKSKARTHTPTKLTREPGRFLTRHQTMINFWLDAALLVVFVVLVWVSVVVQFVFPPAENAAGYSLWGLSLSQFMDIQFGVLAVFVVGIILHLMMHWSWVCGVVGCRLLRQKDGKKRSMDDGQRTILGVGLMIVLLNIMGLGIAASRARDQFTVVSGGFFIRLDWLANAVDESTNSCSAWRPALSGV